MTDLLLLLAHARAAEGGDNRLILSAIRARYEEIADALSIPMDGLFDSLAADAAFSRDRAAAQGERLCAMLFARYAGLPFVDAAELIHFDARGRVDAAKTRAAVQKMARRYSCAVIPGFYGSRPDGEIQTFSRGGSDISGAWIAAALGASLYENWTDVDGLMSADPTLCPDAAAHPLVSYRQMARLSAAGAQVLHPDCLRPVRDAGVPTVIRNTFRPNARAPASPTACAAWFPASPRSTTVGSFLWRTSLSRCAARSGRAPTRASSPPTARKCSSPRVARSV